MQLFRQEALDHRQARGLGELLLVQPVGLRPITCAILLALVGVLALLWWGEAGRRVHLKGMLLPDQGLVQVSAVQAATVKALMVGEGSSVTAGTPLVTLAHELPGYEPGSQAALQTTFDDRLRSFDASGDRARALLAQQAVFLRQRMDGLRAEMRLLAQQTQWQAQRLELAEQAQRRLESLEREAFVSPAQVQAKAEEVLGLRGDAVALERQRQSLEREWMAAEAESRDLPLQVAQQRAALARDRAEIAESAARADPASSRRTWVVRAPVTGRVTAMNLVPGQAVAADAELLTLVPDGAVLQAHLDAPSSALGFLRPGLPVHLQVQAFPYQKFGSLQGWVVQVARSPWAASELSRAGLHPPALGDEPLYRVVVALSAQHFVVDGQAVALVAGMQLEADVLLERRRLLEWMAAPLLGWRQR